ncbi:MAG: YqaE/Pmp3 family membrane protein [Planctomycetaceae bacterium]|nr:YqaE/Pmp3 family membrane protein [Planctomycetaceae bacterium]
MSMTTQRDSTLGDFIKVMFSVLLPPVGVFFEVGLGLHFWLNIVLTLLGYFPGVIHAVYIIARK